MEHNLKQEYDEELKVLNNDKYLLSKSVYSHLKSFEEYVQWRKRLKDFQINEQIY